MITPIHRPKITIQQNKRGAWAVAVDNQYEWELTKGEALEVVLAVMYDQTTIPYIRTAQQWNEWYEQYKSGIMRPKPKPNSFVSI